VLKPLILLELNSDQRREYVNTRQRFQAWIEAKRRKDETRGSMAWATAKGGEYLARSAYDKRGIRRQTSLGPRSPETEKLKQEYERGRQEANERFDSIDDALKRQVAVNRALGLGRVPLTAAKVLRSIDAAGLLGAGLRVIGTNALYAYEASAGVLVDPGVTATGDIDLLFDSRRSIHFVASDDLAEPTLIKVLKGFDDSFERTAQTYQATNKEGYAVDLIKPMRNPPWAADTTIVGDDANTDLAAAEIEGLVWLENAPLFESTVIDEKGVPLRLSTIDPRVFAAHKLWLSQRDGRDPVKKSRDAEQAHVVAQIVVQHLSHLRYEPDEMRMLPKELANAASALFA
jgi:hypothetical protein